MVGEVEVEWRHKISADWYSVLGVGSVLLVRRIISRISACIGDHPKEVFAMSSGIFIEKILLLLDTPEVVSLVTDCHRSSAVLQQLFSRAASRLINSLTFGVQGSTEKLIFSRIPACIGDHSPAGFCQCLQEWPSTKLSRTCIIPKLSGDRFTSERGLHADDLSTLLELLCFGATLRVSSVDV